MKRFEEYLNNLYRPYLGILKVYNSSKRRRKRIYEVNLLFNPKQNSFALFKYNKFYSVGVHEGKLSFNSVETKNTDHFSSDFIVDLEFATELAHATSVEELIQKISKKRDLYGSEATRLLFRFNKILEANVRQIRRRNEYKTHYKKIGHYKIQLEEFVPEEKASELISRLRATVNEHQISIEPQGDFVFHVRNRYDNIPQSGQITILAITKSEKRLLNKYNNAKALIAFNPDPNSSISRFTAVLNQQIVTGSSEVFLQISNGFPFNEDQRKLLSNFVMDSLVLGRGIAGTGKTTVTAHGIIELARSDKRILVVAQPHRVVDNLLKRIVEEAPDLTPDLMRLASKNTFRRLSREARLYHETQIHERLKAEILSNLETAISQEANPEIKSIQKEIKQLLEIQEAQDITKLINLSHRMIFSTIDGLAGNYWKIAPNQITIGQFNEYLQEFDLVVFEDASDMNFVDFVLGGQFGHRWALLSDIKQIQPVVEGVTQFPRYENRTLPKALDEVKIVSSLDAIETPGLAKRRWLERGDKLLRISATNILLSTENLLNTPLCIDLTTNYRFSKEMGEAIEEIFPEVKITWGPRTKEEGRIQQEKADILYKKYQDPFIFLSSRLLGKGTAEREAKLEDGKPSLLNDVEAEKLLAELKSILFYIKDEAIEIAIGMLSPYRAQAELLKQLIRENLNDYEVFEKNDKFVHSPTNTTVDVDTIHKQKSREYDISLISFTRSVIFGLVKRDDYLFTALTRARFVNALFFDIESYQGHRQKTPVWKNLLGLERGQRKRR